MIIVGIDPGAKGGIAFIDSEIGVIDTFKMPLTDGEVDAYDFWKLLPDEECVDVFIENVHSMPGQGVASSFQFGKSYGKIISAVEIPLPGCLQYVSPTTWQKAGPGKTGGDKNITIEWVKKTYPEAQIIPKGCRVPHDGICDAIGIAHYGMLKMKGVVK